MAIYVAYFGKSNNAELAKIKSIKPVDYAFNIVKLHSAMESKQIFTEQKVLGADHISEYIMDFLDALLTVEVKSFEAEVNIICSSYLLGNPDRWNALYISEEIIKTHNNMFEDGAWKHKISKKDQIIALMMKLTEMQTTFDQQIASFATQATKEDTPTPASDSDVGPYCSKKLLNILISNLDTRYKSKHPTYLLLVITNISQ